MQVTIGVKGGMRKMLFEPVALPAIKVDEVQTRVTGSLQRAAQRINDPVIKSAMTYGVPLVFLASGLPPIGIGRAMAHAAGAPSGAVMAGDAIPAMGDAIKGKIMHAFDPLIDLIVSLSYPVAGVMIAGGCLFVMVGNRDRGMQLLQNAAIGYLLMQLSPLMLDLLVGIGESV